MAKDEHQSLNPIKYRVLLILPTVYTKWAMTRLRDMDPWIETWATPEMHAGVRGTGAQDGWYGTAVEIERTLLEPEGHEHLTGAIADIHKCFDQIQREVVYRIAERAGMPKRVLRAYRSVQEKLQARNSVAGQIGEAYPKPTSIPQGDRLSMMLVAFIMRPWIMIMREIGTIPRVLADDILILVLGPEHAAKLKQAYDVSHQYLKAMGAQIAADKSAVFSTCRRTRQWLRKHIWEELGENIEVANNIKDLGAHLNLTKSPNAAVLNDRLVKAITRTVKLRHLKVGMKTTTESIRVFCHTLALYGAEVAQPKDGLLARYKTAVVNAISAHHRNRSVDLTFHTCSLGRDLDPEIAILVNRVMAMRRYTSANAEARYKMELMLSMYTAEKHKGTDCTPEALKKLYEEGYSPPAGAKGRGQWKYKGKSPGPLSLLLSSSHLIGAAMDKDFCIHKHDESYIDLINTPVQEIKHLISESAARSRTRAAEGKRK